MSDSQGEEVWAFPSGRAAAAGAVEPLCGVSSGADIPNADEIETAIRNRCAALIAAREALAAQMALIERDLHRFMAAARAFRIDLPSPVSLSRPTVPSVVAEILSSAGQQGATVTEMRPAVEGVTGPLHEKSVGIALRRMCKAGLVRREGRRWFALPRAA